MFIIAIENNKETHFHDGTHETLEDSRSAAQSAIDGIPGGAADSVTVYIYELKELESYHVNTAEEV